jgi:hypothetical protein
VTLDRWQELILQAAMGERSNRTWAAQRVGVSVSRQNGKSQLLVARALAGALLFGEKKIVISAHQQDTARETFAKFMEIIEDDGNAFLRSYIKPRGIMQALNREAIKFANGCLVQFKARTAAGGRGFSSDCLLLDEAQRLGQSAMVSINSTMSARENPQLWMLGTPPTPEDDGSVFQAMRNAALSGASNGLAYLEWSADPASDLSSEYARWQANPAWNTRINHEVVQGEFETYSAERFNIDRLGIWPSDVTATRAISADLWSSTAVTEPPAGGIRSFGVAFSLDGSRQAVAGAIKAPDGTVHVELIDAQSGNTDAGVAALADWLAERWRDTAMIGISGRAGAAALQDELHRRHVPTHVSRTLNTSDYFASCSIFMDGLKSSQVTHPQGRDTDILEASVAVCDQHMRGSAWGWEATTDDGDETPLEAVSVANWAARTSRRQPGRKQVLV